MFEQDNTLSLIAPILLDNKFVEVGGNIDTFENGKCTIEIDLKEVVYNLYYRDKNNTRFMVTSDNLNLYWLFGFLSANDLIDRNFKL